METGDGGAANIGRRHHTRVAVLLIRRCTRCSIGQWVEKIREQRVLGGEVVGASGGRQAADRIRSAVADRRHHRNVATIQRHLPLVCSWLDEAGFPSSGWVIDSVPSTRTSAAVALLSNPATGDAVAMRVTGKEEGPGLERAARATAAVRNSFGGEPPFAIADSLLVRYVGPECISLESRLPGRHFDEVGLDALGAAEEARAAVMTLHTATAVREKPTAEQVLMLLPKSHLKMLWPGITQRMERVVDNLRSTLLATELDLARTHGDLNLGNVLFTPGQPTGVAFVDWETSLDRGLRATDGISLVLDLRQMAGRSEIGTVVRSILTRGYTDGERRFLQGFGDHAVDPLYLWVWWAAFTNHCLQSAPRLKGHPVWLTYNVQRVLELFEGSAAPSRG